MGRETSDRMNMHRQRGFSLIEMMVAMVLGLFIMGGVTKVFLDSKSANQARGGQSNIGSNARVAMDILSADIARGGYVPAATVELPKVNGKPLPPVETAYSSDSGTASDSIIVTYVSNTDCLGNATPTANPRITRNKYQLKRRDDAKAASSENPWQLYCGPVDNDGNTTSTAQPLVEGVEEMQFLYGVDSDGDGIANEYETGDYVNTSGTQNKVVSVRIGLLTYSINQARDAGEKDTNTYRILDTNYTPPEDGNTRRVFVKTVPMRNAMFRNRRGSS